MAAKEILAEVMRVFASKWETREGQKVPDTEDIALGNDGVRLDATVMYADLTDSTGLVIRYRHTFSAEIYKAYLTAACRAIRLNGGEITAFDGDRVMAVFIGTSKNTSAAKAALQLNYLVGEINQLMTRVYADTTFRIAHTVGIDTGSLLVARTGIRDSNDLVWVGRCANYAAKLCELGDQDYPTFITEDVFDKLHSSSKSGGNPLRPMWYKTYWSERQIVVYKSNWWWEV